MKRVVHNLSFLCWYHVMAMKIFMAMKLKFKTLLVAYQYFIFFQCHELVLFHGHNLHFYEKSWPWFFFIGRIDDIHGHEIEFHYNFMAILEEIDTFSWHCEKCSNVISWHIFMGSWEFHGIFTVFSWTVLPVVNYVVLANETTMILRQLSWITAFS